ncbi:MAG: metal-dependent transcriptional regulator [Clostridia bacterium]|nr:metal-dependent transcriptional regulator [Clostridia bacterium]
MTELKDTRISEALEDYLEAIYLFSRKKSSVRITDIAIHLGISKPSVNRAVNTLKKQGYVSHEPYGDVILTEKGRALGYDLYDRHRMIKKFLINVLHLSVDEAEKEACQIEHNISQSTVDKMVSFMEN